VLHVLALFDRLEGRLVAVEVERRDAARDGDRKLTVTVTVTSVRD
jgi:hypothetical protein